MAFDNNGNKLHHVKMCAEFILGLMPPSCGLTVITNKVQIKHTVLCRRNGTHMLTMCSAIGHSYSSVGLCLTRKTEFTAFVWPERDMDSEIIYSGEVI